MKRILKTNGNMVYRNYKNQVHSMMILLFGPKTKSVQIDTTSNLTAREEIQHKQTKKLIIIKSKKHTKK